MTRTERRRVALAWLPAVSWMALIWFVSSLAQPDFPVSSFPLRDKGVHFVVYASLGFFVAHAALRTWSDRPRVRLLATAVFVTVMWGVLDEIHQAFVPGRSSDTLDVVADGVGAVVGTGLRELTSRIFGAAKRREGSSAS